MLCKTKGFLDVNLKYIEELGFMFEFMSKWVCKHFYANIWTHMFLHELKP